MSHQALSVGDQWWEMGAHSQDEQAKAQTLKFLIVLGPQVVGQWVALSPRLSSMTS